MSVPIRLFTDSQRPVFLVNSRLGHFSATSGKYFLKINQRALHQRPHFSRSYVCILPSSLTRVLSSALEYSSHLPVSVFGTVPVSLALEIISWRLDYTRFAFHEDQLALTTYLSMWIFLHTSTACGLDPHYHRRAGLHLTRHPFETNRGTGI